MSTETQVDAPSQAPSQADDAVDHVGRRLRTLEQCALHRRTFRLTCRTCGHIRLLDAVPLWWLFVTRGWDDHLPQAIRRLCCQPCRGTGRVVPFAYKGDTRAAARAAASVPRP